MKKLLIISLLFITSCASLNNKFDGLIIAQKYVPGTEDIPVFSGFQPIEAKNVVYDSENGRIIDANYVRSNIKTEEVRQFYSETLSQLGWRKNKSAEYTRDGEKLKLNVSEKNGAVYLKFNIRPVG